MKKIKLRASLIINLLIIVFSLELLFIMVKNYPEFFEKITFIKTDVKHSYKPCWNSFDLVEKSIGSDDSVCIVSDMSSEQKEYWSKYYKKANGGDYLTHYVDNMAFYDHMQRISSSQFVQISYTYKQPFFSFKKDKTKKGEEGSAVGKNFGGRLESVNLQIYDINKKKVVAERKIISKNDTDVSKWKEFRHYACARRILICRDYANKEKCDVVIPYDLHNNETTSKYNFYVKDANNLGKLSKEKVYPGEGNYVSVVSHSKFMDIVDFRKLLKKNGINPNGIYQAYNLVDYNDINLVVRTESLPKKDAYLYKLYPRLKKYIGKKGKWARFYLKGVKDTDEIVSYFLAVGKKVSYGNGIPVEIYNSDKEDVEKIKVRSLEEYCKKEDPCSEVTDDKRLSADLFDFK